LKILLPNVPADTDEHMVCIGWRRAVRGIEIAQYQLTQTLCL